MAPRISDKFETDFLEEFGEDPYDEGDSITQEFENCENPEMYILGFIRFTEKKLLRDEAIIPQPIMTECIIQLVRLKNIYITKYFNSLLPKLMDKSFVKTEVEEFAVKLATSYMRNIDRLIYQ